jgi:hypothetical protein
MSTLSFCRREGAFLCHTKSYCAEIHLSMRSHRLAAMDVVVGKSDPYVVVKCGKSPHLEVGFICRRES